MNETGEQVLMRLQLDLMLMRLQLDLMYGPRGSSAHLMPWADKHFQGETVCGRFLDPPLGTGSQDEYERARRHRLSGRVRARTSAAAVQAVC